MHQSIIKALGMCSRVLFQTCSRPPRTRAKVCISERDVGEVQDYHDKIFEPGCTACSNLVFGVRLYHVSAVYLYGIGTYVLTSQA